MARVTVDKENHLPVDIHYEDRGSGRPVVLIHGWPLSSGQWEFQIPDLLAQPLPEPEPLVVREREPDQMGLFGG